MNRRGRQRRGFVLIVALVVTFALASLVLTLGRMARTESLASTNQLAGYEAACVERGAEQYVVAMLANNIDTLGDLTDDDFAQVPVGNGYFWIVRPDYLDTDLPQFGLVDEASKIPLNTVTSDQLMAMTNMDQDTATAIVDWRTADAEGGGNMQSSAGAYRNKAGPFETVEELLMIPGVTRELYFGDDALTRMGAAQPSTLTGNDALRAAGWQNFFTAWTTTATPVLGQPQATGPEIAINTAPRDVLITLFSSYGLTSSDIDSALASRASAVESNPASTDWAKTAFTGLNPATTSRFVPHSTKFSADIVAVSGNGRAFRRVRIVVDASSTTAAPQIVYRRDITTNGFPLDASILDSLRNGTLVSTSSASSRSGGKL